MNEIKILSLSLRNFKGIKELDLPTAGGEDVNVYGENGTGKTTIMDAFIWLLFDKDSANSSNFNIKTLDEDGNPLHGLEHEVIANLLINDKEIELQKIYKENWVKKKGQSEEELSGHTKNYFINGVPKKQKEYNEYLGNIVKEENFKILTNPLYFNTNLSWKERRNIILDLEKDIQEEEIYKKDKELLSLKELLEDKSIDDLKKEMSSRRSKLNEELKTIPSRIDELSRMDNEEVDIEKLNSKKKELEERLYEIKNSDSKDYDFQVRRMNGSINILENEIKDLERSLTEEIREELEAARKDKFNIEKQLSELESKEFKLDKGVIALKQGIDSLKADINDLREKFKDVRVSEFEGDKICPTCQQNLPIDEVEAAMDKFEANKSKSLTEINEAGKSNKKLLQDKEKELEKKEKELAEVKEEIETVEFLLKGKNNVIEKLEDKLKNIGLEGKLEYKENKTKIAELEAEKEKVLEAKNNQQDISSTIKKIEDEILEINKDLAKVDLVKENKKRVDELMTRETELAQNIAETERMEFLCDKYVITKSSLLEDQLNDKFSKVKFKLFDKQVNGGINETFVTTVNGVPFEDLNNAMKIQAGLDIITTLSKQYGLIAPIFIDNRESINTIPDMDNQIINLIVSKHKNLRIEVQ